MIIPKCPVSETAAINLLKASAKMSEITAAYQAILLAIVRYQVAGRLAVIDARVSEADWNVVVVDIETYTGISHLEVNADLSIHSSGPIQMMLYEPCSDGFKIFDFLDVLALVRHLDEQLFR